MHQNLDISLLFMWKFFFSVPCSDKSTFVSPISAFFCRSAERLNISAAKLQTLHSVTVCMSFRGHCSLDLPSWSCCLFWNNSGQAITDGKSSETQGLLCSREKRGCTERQKIKFRANFIVFVSGD